MQILVRVGVNAIALWVAAALVGGMSLSGDLLQVLLVAVVFGLVNAFIRPVLKLLSLPLIALTLGLFTLVVNALMLLLTDALTEGLAVEGFGSALLGAIVISLISWALSMFVPDKD